MEKTMDDKMKQAALDVLKSLMSDMDGMAGMKVEMLGKKKKPTDESPMKLFKSKSIREMLEE
jgi:hypothetical protein